MKSSYVPPSPTIADNEKFTKCVPSMENSLTLLNTYTYNSTSKKVSQKIIKRIKVKQDLQEKVMDQNMLFENTSTNPMVTAI